MRIEPLGIDTKLKEAVDLGKFREQIASAFLLPSLPPERPESALREHVRRMALYKARRDEAALVEMLGRWVSELEPTYCVDRSGNILGLAVVNDPTGTICVRPPLDQFMMNTLKQMLPDATPTS